MVPGRKAGRRTNRLGEEARFPGAEGRVRVYQAKGTDAEGLCAEVQKPEEDSGK